MKILAADTSTSSGSVAFLDGERVVAEWILESAQTHNRRLLKSIHLFLQEVEWSIREIDAFAVTIGPGSFTGLRIGLTTIKTLAWTLSKPYIGVPTLDALAAPFRFSSQPVCTLLDAQRKQVYAGFFEPDGRGALNRRGNYQVLSPLEVLRKISAPTIFCGNGWTAHKDFISTELGDLVIPASPPFHLIRASFVAETALSRFLRGEADEPLRSVPLYIRPSEAELNNPRPVHT